MHKTLIVVMLAASCLGCQPSSSVHGDKRAIETPQRVIFAYTTQPQSTLAHVAKAKGFFSEEGLDVEPLLHTYGKAALQSVIENKADFATVAESPVMFSVLRGDEIFVLANIEASTTNNAIVARRDAGIAVSGDLKGKRIGFTQGTTSDFFLDSMLTANGISRQQIQPVALKPEAMQEAILAGKVDAVSTWNYPLTQIKQHLGAEGVIFYDREIYTETFNVASRQDFVNKNPDAVKRLLRALIKAENYVARYPDEAQNILAAATKTDKSLVRDVWNNFNYRVRLDQTLLITLEDETRWAMKNKLTDKAIMPNYANYLYADGLKAVKPEAFMLNK